MQQPVKRHAVSSSLLPGGKRSRKGGLVLRGPLTIAALLAGCCATLYVFARPKGDIPARGATPAAASTNRRFQVAQNTAQDGPSVEATPTVRRSVDFYTGSVRGSMFTAPQPPEPKPVPVVVVKKPAPPVVKPAPPVIVEVKPFAEWTYTGTVQMDNTVMALLENTRTKEGQYVQQGDTFMGAQVESVSPQEVRLSSAGKPTMLAKSDNITVTPLDRSAAYLTAGPAQPGQPGMPGDPNAAQGMPAMQGRWGGGGGFTLPNGVQLDPQRAQQYQNFMNRRFNGGGGGNGGGNGGGGGRGNRGGGGGFGGGGRGGFGGGGGLGGG